MSAIFFCVAMYVISWLLTFPCSFDPLLLIQSLLSAAGPSPADQWLLSCIDHASAAD